MVVQSPVAISRPTLEFVAILSILMCSSVLRYWNVTVGLPTLYVHDEIFEVHRALELLRGEYNFVRMKGVYFYGLSCLSGIYGILLVVRGHFSDLGSFVAYSLVHPGDIVLLSRVICATLGTLSVYLVYRLGKVVYSKESPGPLLLALAWATCALAVWTSKWGLIETLVVVFGIAAFFPILHIVKNPNKPSYIFSGILIAAATATKVYGVLLFLPLVFAHIIAKKSMTGMRVWQALYDGKLILSFCVFVTSLFVLNPVLFKPLMGSGEIIQKLSADTKEIYPLAHYFTYLRWNLGNMGFVLFVVGAVIAVVRFDKKVCICGFFALSFFLALGLKKEAVFIYDRYLLISLPLFFVVAVYGVEGTVRWLQEWIRPPWLRILAKESVVMVAALGFAWNGIAMLMANPVMGTTFSPVYEQALVWFEKNIPEGATVVVRGETRPWPGNQSLPLYDTEENYLRLYAQKKQQGKSPAEIDYIKELAKAKGLVRYNLVNETRYVTWKHPDEYIKKNGAQYFVVDVEYFTGEVGAKRSLQATLSRRKFYNDLRESDSVRLLKTFHGRGVTGVSRTIEIYKVNEIRESVAFGSQ